MWAAFVVCSVVALGVAPFLSSWLTILFAQLFLLGVAYSAPPLRLKDRPLAGLFANAYAFGVLIPLTAVGEIGLDCSYLPVWWLAAYFTLAVAGVHILTTLPDREGDRATGKKTMAAVLNAKTAKLLALLFLAASAAVAFRLGHAHLMYISIFAVIVLAMSVMFRSAALDLFAAKMPILLLTILAGVFFTGYLVFVVVLLIACRLYFKKRFGIIYPQLA
jgi:chlorophyll synthase